MIVDDALASELVESLPGLLDYFSYSQNSSDYVCVFCDTRAKTNNNLVEHKPDCLGVKLREALRENPADG